MKKLFKKLTALIVFILALIMAFAFVGCSSGLDDAYGGGWGSGGSHSPDYAPEDSFGEAAGDPDGTEGGGNQNSQKPIVKQLTAAEWRDALNYDFWLGLFDEDIPVDGQNEQDQLTRNGLFYSYAKATRGLDTFDMHEVYITSEGHPVVGAKVKLYNENDVIYSAVSDSAGKAYVFGTGTSIEAVSGPFRASESVADGVTNIELTDFAAVENELEIMLVVDTTGSMGDELRFLCNELAGVVTRVSSALNCNIRLGLLFYRDKGDEYVTLKYDFTEVTTTSGLNAVVENIDAQKSAGGGDYPEAVDTALSEAVAMNWHTNSKTKLIFQVLDAPYHDEQENQSKFASAVQSAAEKGIRVIPVAASGLNTLGQYIMRSAALLTGGTYTFLTDDSGIGDSHELPAVGEFTVEYLSDLMVRLIKGYYTGAFEEPIPWTQSESVV